MEQNLPLRSEFRFRVFGACLGEEPVVPLPKKEGGKPVDVVEKSG